MQIEMLDLPDDLSQKMLSAPFVSHLLRPVPFGLSPDNFMWESCQSVLDKYQQTHLGICFAEWDSQAFFQSWSPTHRFAKDLVAAFGEPPANRWESVAKLEQFWQWHKEIFFGNIWGMSGGMAFPQYGVEWGGKIAGMELTSHTSTIPYRTLLRFTAGAGRQYNKPWLLYLAYYLGKFSPNSTRPMGDRDSRLWTGGPDAGISPSFAMRTFFTAYFMGANYFSFEAEPWGQAEMQRDGKAVLNPNGKVLKNFYEWSRSLAGKRGEWYAPILLGLDYGHGQTRRNGFIWGYKIVPEPGDLMSEHIGRAIDYYDGELAAWDKPPYSHNLHNSELGDIFDTAFINPPSGTTPMFKNYPVVILADNCDLSSTIRSQLEEYVYNGGTLVFNSTHTVLVNSEIMPLEFDAGEVCEDGMIMPKFPISSKFQVIMQTAGGNPFAIKYRFGNGHAIMTIPKYLQGSDPEQPLPYIAQLLKKIQAEVLPFKVEGDLQFVLNRIGDHHWKLALINNKGVLKQPWEREERFDLAFQTTARITLPENSTIQEILYNTELLIHNNICEVELPPGGVRIMEIMGADVPSDKQLPLIGIWKLDNNTKGITEVSYQATEHDMEYVPIESGRKVYQASNPETELLLHFVPRLPLKSATLSFWVAPDLDFKLSSNGGYPVASRFFHVALRKNRWYMYATNAGSISANIPGPLAEHNRWTHIALTWSPSELRFFVDGVEYTLDGVPFKSFISGWESVLHVGTYGRGRRTFGGKIADLRLYSKALEPEQIVRQMKVEKTELLGKD